jgi:large repetitive protein
VNTRCKPSGFGSTLTLATVSGLSFSAGDGTASATITFTGTITNVNAAMNWMTFAPTTNFVAEASVRSRGHVLIG